MPDVLTRARRPGEAILSEASGNRSRDNLTLAASQDFPANTLLGKVTVGGQYKAWNPDAEDGTEDAVALSIYAAKTGAGETKSIAAVTTDAELMARNIAWPAGADAADKALAAASLATVGIKLR